MKGSSRFDLLEEAYRLIPPDKIKARLFEHMRRVAARFSDLGVTRIYRIDGAR